MSRASALEELLAMPTQLSWGVGSWDRMTTGDVLFRALQEAVPAQERHDWNRLLSSVLDWEPFPESLASAKSKVDVQQLRRRWDLVRRLVWCASQAATRPGSFGNELDRIGFNHLTELPEFAEDDRARLWGWIRTFLRASETTVTVAVALSNERESRGFIVELEVAAVIGAAGAVFPHPADALSTRCGSDFMASMCDAWHAARAASKLADESLSFGGRYRVLRNGQPISEVDGRSASGAAALGWQLALLKKLPDAGVIVLAEVRESGNDYVLGGVDGAPVKVAAIAESGRFDTIVVADRGNQHEAEEALRAAKNTRIRVVNLDGPMN